MYQRMVANIADAPQVFPLGETHGYSAALGYAILARIMETSTARVGTPSCGHVSSTRWA